MASMSAPVFAGVELGGTKCICIMGTGPDDIRAQEVIPTGDPQTTLAAIAAVLERFGASTGSVTALGVAAFGPLCLHRGSHNYGRIGATSKVGWTHVDLRGFFAARFGGPLGLTTDVIGAALAEGRWGGAQGLTDYAYVTVGTGIGVGLVAAGKAVVGCHHPELGHVRIARADGDQWPGNCPFHGDCLEGLTSGPAIEARGKTAAKNLAAESPIWTTVVQALAQLAHILVVSFAPQRVLIGGGVVSSREYLFPRIRQSLVQSLNGYLDVEELKGGLDQYLIPPGLGTRAGPLGALAVAADASVDRRPQ